MREQSGQGLPTLVPVDSLLLGLACTCFALQFCFEPPPKVSTERGEQLAAQHNMKFFETSAKASKKGHSLITWTHLLC